MKTSESTAKLDAALAKAQGRFAPVTKNAKNPHLRNSYADLGAVVHAIGEALSSEGVAWVQSVDLVDGGHVVTTRIAHQGEWVLTTCPVIWSKGKGVNEAQSFGGGLTYARRYALMAAFGLAPEDDDGHSAGRRQQAQQAEQQGGRKARRVSVQDFESACDRLSIPIGALNAYRVQVQSKPRLEHGEDEWHLGGVLTWVENEGGAAQVRAWMEQQQGAA